MLSIQRFTNEEIAKDLQSSLRFAKTQFNARPELVLEALKLPVSAANVQRLFVNTDAGGLQEAVDRWAKSLEFLEMLTVFDARQNVLVRTNGKISSSSFLRGQLLNSLFDRRQPIITTELVPYEEYCQEVSVDVCQALQGHKDIMIQIILLPVIDQEGRIIGAIVAGDDVNKDPHLPYAQQKVFGKSVEMLITQRGSELPAPCPSLRVSPQILRKRLCVLCKPDFHSRGHHLCKAVSMR